MRLFNLLLTTLALFSASAYADLDCTYEKGATKLKLKETGGYFTNEITENTRYPVHIIVGGSAKSVDENTLLLRGRAYVEGEQESVALLYVSPDQKSVTLDALRGEFVAATFSCH